MQPDRSACTAHVEKQTASDAISVSTAAQGRCVGVLGRLLGHKFKYGDPHRVYVVDNCLRCGMPKGGWSK